MSKALLVLLLGFAAAPAVAQSPSSEAGVNVKTIYGTNVGSLEGKFTMNVGSGEPNNCGTKIWYHNPQHILKKESAGTCTVEGATGSPVAQYKITYVDDTPAEQHEQK
jgi:hypothetical protein